MEVNTDEAPVPVTPPEGSFIIEQIEEADLVTYKVQCSEDKAEELAGIARKAIEKEPERLDMDRPLFRLVLFVSSKLVGDKGVHKFFAVIPHDRYHAAIGFLEKAALGVNLSVDDPVAPPEIPPRDPNHRRSRRRHH